MASAVSAVRDRLRLPGCRVVISFPKSGRTQLRVMLDALGLAVPFSHAGSSDERGRTAAELGGGPSYWRRCKVLLLIRDPRDTAVSAWYHARYRSGRFGGDLATFLRDPHFGLEKVVSFHLLWAEARPRFPTCAVLHYEELQRRPEHELGRVAHFLAGRSFAPEAIARAAEAGSFQRMRALEAGGEGARRFGVALTPGDPLNPDSFKTRKGVSGGWAEALSAADKDYADALFGAHDYTARLAAAGIASPFAAPLASDASA
jgi:hypothetical protein